MKKLKLPNKNDCATDSKLQIRVNPVDDSADVEIYFRTISNNNWHGLPIGDTIIVKKCNLVAFLNLHNNNNKNVIGYRYYGFVKSNLDGVHLPHLNKTTLNRLFHNC